MSETENTSPEQQETQAPDKRRSCKIFLAKAAFTLGTLAVFYGGYLYYFVVRSLTLTSQNHNVYYVYVLRITNFLALKT